MKSTLALFLALLITSCHSKENKTITSSPDSFVRIENTNLIKPNGDKLLLQGINLGNWLNPEGYMFLFKGASSYRLINQAFCEMVGEDFTNLFWTRFKQNYITRDDIHFIKQTGMNSIRIPFHYKLFTDEDYMGLTHDQDGFTIIDSVLSWCKAEGLYAILDMHDAPGGQTGDNIDDSYAYPWLMKNEESKLKYCAIWKRIAAHYSNNTTVIGYDLLNEPIANYFIQDEPNLNDSLEVLYNRVIHEIRKVDTNHIVLLGGAQWDANFKVFKNSQMDTKLMYTCHRYWCDTLQANIQDFVHFRDSVNLPIYMGETGENNNVWVGGFTRLLERNNIGWHYWPYKKMVPESCMRTIPTPKNWNVIVDYVNSDRSSFELMRKRPNQEVVKQALLELLENMKMKNCIKNDDYIHALGMHP